MTDTHGHTVTWRRQHAGHSLLEVLIVLALLALGLLAANRWQMGLNESAEWARQHTEATRLAQETLEQLRLLPPQQTPGQMPDQETAVATSGTLFERSWRVSTESSQVARHAQVTVKWIDRNGVNQHLQMDSVLARVDPRFSAALGATPPLSAALRLPQ